MCRKLLIMVKKYSHLPHHLKYSTRFIQNGCILLQNQHITSKIRKTYGFYIIMLSTTPLPFQQLFNCMNISFLPILFLILFFLRVLLRFFSELDKLDGFKANLVNMGSGWPFLYGFFFTKDGFNVYSYCNMYESCILFFLHSN